MPRMRLVLFAMAPLYYHFIQSTMSHSITDNEMGEFYSMMRTIVLASIVALLVILWVRQRYRRSRTAQVSPPDNLPPLAPTQGGLFATISLFVSNKLPFTLLEWSRAVGPVFRLPFPGNRVVAVVGDPGLARRILNDPSSTKTRAYGWMERIASGDTFFSTEGHRCTHVRKAATPAFGTARVDDMTELCRQHAEEWIQESSTRIQEPLNILFEMQRVTTRFLVEAAFDYRMSEQEVHIVLDSFQTACQEYASKRALNPAKVIFGRFHPSVRRAQHASAQLQSLARRILQNYREGQGHTETAQGTLIERIVLDEEYSTDEERVRDIIAFLFGGYETTAVTLSFALLELARNQVEQEALHKKLTKVQQGHEEQRESCFALKNVIRETLRLHPAPAVASVRKVAKDFEYGDTVIPAGSSVCISSFLIHRNERVFEDPDLFLPGRWVDPNPQQLEAFMPFGLGRRSCVGRAVANAELYVILSRLCREYEFSVVDEGEYDYVITHKTVGMLLLAQPWSK